MAEVQTLDSEMLKVKEDVTFTPLELKYFVLELKDMFAEGKFDLAKVIHAARYWAELERRDNDIKAGRNLVMFTDEEWERFINDKDWEKHLNEQKLS